MKIPNIEDSKTRTGDDAPDLARPDRRSGLTSIPTVPSKLPVPIEATGPEKLPRYLPVPVLG